MAKKEYSLAHTKWMCKYHIVFTPKYRRKVIYNQYKEDIRDISVVLGHDKPHIGVQTGGKRGAGGAQRVNLTYDGEQHPYRSSIKGEGNITCH